MYLLAVFFTYFYLRLEDTYAARHMKIRPPLHVSLNYSSNRVIEENVQGGVSFHVF